MKQKKVKVKVNVSVEQFFFLAKRCFCRLRDESTLVDMAKMGLWRKSSLLKT